VQILIVIVITAQLSDRLFIVLTELSIFIVLSMYCSLLLLLLLLLLFVVVVVVVVISPPGCAHLGRQMP